MMPRAFLAISLRRSTVSLSARALPPLSPPRRPDVTAGLLGSGRDSSSVASPAISKADLFRSRDLFLSALPPDYLLGQSWPPSNWPTASASQRSRFQLTACLGGACYDVYLNDVAYWRCVPARVWKYTIGGYQVMKKWLSYRERPLLGRDLKPDEGRYVTEMTRRIAAILLLEPALDANYERVKADPYAWPGA